MAITLIPHKYLNENADLIPLLAKWVTFKRAFRNSVIYNYNPHNLASKNRLPYSRNTIKKAVDDFIREGLAYLHHGNLVLVPQRELLKQVGHKKGYGKWVQMTDQHDYQIQLRHALLVTKKNQVEWAKEKRATRYAQQQRRPNKKLRKYLKRIQSKQKVKASLVMSVKSIAELFACSPRKASQTLTQLHKMGWITKKTKEVRLVARTQCKYVAREIIERNKLKFRHLFFHHGLILGILPTEIHFSPLPLSQP